MQNRHARRFAKTKAEANHYLSRIDPHNAESAGSALTPAGHEESAVGVRPISARKKGVGDDKPADPIRPKGRTAHPWAPPTARLRRKEVEQVLLSPLEVARMLGYHRNSVYLMVHNGTLPSVSLGGAAGQIRIPKQAVIDIIASAMGKAEGSSR